MSTFYRPSKPNHAMAYLGHVSSRMSFVEDYPVESPGADECIVQLEASGVCASDLAAREANSCKRDLVGGHEGVGRVVEIGSDVINWKVGDRIGVPCFACTSCDVCVSGYESHCPTARFMGFHFDGTFQRFVKVKAAYAMKIPECLPSAQACVIMCAGVTVYRALKLTRPLPGSWVAISGACGGLGHLAVQYAKVMGCKVVAIDSGHKRAFAESLEVDAFVDFDTSKGAAAEVIDLTEGGVSVSLITTGNPESYTQSILYTRPLGTVVCIGLSRPATISISDIITKSLRVIGTATGTRADCAEAVAVAMGGKVAGRVTIRHLTDANEVLDELKDIGVEGRFVFDYTV